MYSDLSPDHVIAGRHIFFKLDFPASKSPKMSLIMALNTMLRFKSNVYKCYIILLLLLTEGIEFCQLLLFLKLPAECCVKTHFHIITRRKVIWISMGVNGQRTMQMSSIQNVALQVGQGTVLDNQVSGLCWSWRLANHRPRQDRHHMGLQKHFWHSDSLSTPSVWHSLTSLVLAGTCIQPIQGSISCALRSVYG